MEKEKDLLAPAIDNSSDPPTLTIPKRESPFKLILIIALSVSAVLILSAALLSIFLPIKDTSNEDKFIQTSASSPWFTVSHGVISKAPDYTEPLPAELIIPEKFDGVQIKAIEAYAFRNCSGAVKITVPASIDEIGSGAFQNIKALKEITLPSIEEINIDTFSGCENLEKVFCEKVRVIYQRAFLNCKNLRQINAPSLSSVGASAFEGCESLSEINTENISKYGEKALSRTYSLSSIKIKSGAKLSSYALSYSGIESISFLGNVSLEAGVFRGCEKLSEAFLPSTLTSIPSELFYGCLSLKSFTVDENITSLGDNIFVGCTSLESVTIKAKIKKLPVGSFDSCSSLKSVTYPDSVTEIGERAFAYSGISKTLLSTNIKKIESSAYEGCINIKAVTIPFGVEAIGYRAFADCVNLESISFPTTLIELGESAFEACTSLSEFEIPSTVTELGDSVLRECSNLKILYLYSNATVSGTLTEGCTALEKITVSSFNEKYTDINGVLLSRDKTRIILFPANHSEKSYTAPKSVTTIDAYAFIHSNIEAIELSNVEMIGMNAFESCKMLEKAALENVSHIGYGAFKNCERLTEVLTSKALKQIDGEAFAGCSSLKTITLPLDADIADNTFPDTTEKYYFQSDK